jgi:probable F420-dependent oxidoreductase
MTATDVVDSFRHRLGPVGVCLPSLGPAPAGAERSAARDIEELGYGSIWAGEAIGGKEAFAHQSLLLAATDRIVTGTGIANVWARHPATMVGGAMTLGSAYPGRFVLGVGISHAPMVERSGQLYQSPLARMSDYLDGMDAAAKDAPHAEVAVPRVLAALGPKMLGLARDRGDGAYPYFVPTSYTPIARRVLGAGKLLVVAQAVVLASGPSEARLEAREYTARYLQLPNYSKNLKRLGYGDDDLSGGGSQRLVDAIVAWEDEQAVGRRVREHLDSGADHVILQPLGDLSSALRQLTSLAPTVLAS